MRLLKFPATLLWLPGILVAAAAHAHNNDNPAYRSAALPVEERVADLMSRMTLEEKAAQLIGTWQNPQFVDPKLAFVGPHGEFLPDRAALTLKNGMGQMTRPSENRGPREMAEFTNTVQK